MTVRPADQVCSIAPRAMIAAFVLASLYGASSTPQARGGIAGRSDRSSDHVAVADPQSGQALLLLKLDQPLRYGQFVWRDNVPGSSPLWIRVNRKAQLVSVFRGRLEIGAAVILYGSPSKPTPAGTFTVREKLKEHRSSLYDADMPFTLRLTDDGISIHASPVRPNAATHGCIGLPSTFARLLFEQARKGDRVVVL